MTPPDAHRDVGVRTVMLVDTPRILRYRFWTGSERYRVILPVLSYEFQLGIRGYRLRTAPWGTPFLYHVDVTVGLSCTIPVVSRGV